jgi:hypothetical protein
MTELTGVVKLPGSNEQSLRVEIHLDREELRLLSMSGELGRWPLHQVGINAQSDGFHLRVEGEELILTTSDDARFALAIGLRSSSSPRLNRQLASVRDLQGTTDVSAVALEESSLPAINGHRTDWRALVAPSRHKFRPMAVGFLIAAGLVFIGGLIPLTSGSQLEMLGAIPVWPVTLIAGVMMAAGAFSIVSEVPGGRTLVGAGTVLGLLTLVGAIAGAGESELGWVNEGILPLGLGATLGGLLLSLDVAHESKEA